MTTPSIQLTMTKAGYARFTAAQLGQAIDLRVASVGVTNTPFISAPTLTAIPGEIKRITTVSGAKVGDNTVHLMIRDFSSDTYSVVGIGLYLTDGTLFALYGQPTPIFQKSPLTTFLIALDLTFVDASINALTFGDANFLDPPATTDTAGVLPLATLAQAQAGTDATRAIVPAVLAAMLSPINTAVTALQNAAGVLSAAFSALLARTITGGGLVTGGGDFSASRVLTVTPATADQAAAGVDNTTAVTPASLATILGVIAGKVPLLRKISTAGLLQGGATLGADLTLSVPKASAVMVGQASDDASAVTPLALAAIVALANGAVQQTRKVSTSGLLGGGGALTGDLALTIGKATAAMLAAGTDDGSVPTPLALASLPKSLGASGYVTFPGGFILQWVIGSQMTANSETTQTLTLPMTFPNRALRALVCTQIPSSSNVADAFFQLVGDPAAGSVTVQRQITANASDQLGSSPIVFVLGN